MSAIPCQDAQCGWRRAGWIFVLTCSLGWVPYCRAQPAQLYEDLLIFVSVGALVSSGLQEGSYPYPSQRFLEEQVPGRWRWLPPTPPLHSVFGTLLWCFCLPPHLPNQFLCDVCLFYWRLGAECRCQRAFLLPAASWVSPILVESRPIAHAGVWGPTCPGLTLAIKSHFFCSSSDISSQAIDGNGLTTHTLWPWPTWFPLSGCPLLPLHIL